jgi:hypothetical protein
MVVDAGKREKEEGKNNRAVSDCPVVFFSRVLKKGMEGG